MKVAIMSLVLGLNFSAFATDIRVCVQDSNGVKYENSKLVIRESINHMSGGVYQGKFYRFDSERTEDQGGILILGDTPLESRKVGKIINLDGSVETFQENVFYFNSFVINPSYASYDYSQRPGNSPQPVYRAEIEGDKGYVTAYRGITGELFFSPSDASELYFKLCAR